MHQKLSRKDFYNLAKLQFLLNLQQKPPKTNSYGAMPIATETQNTSVTAVTRGHFDAWSTDQEFPIVILIWQTRFTEIAVSRKL